MNWRIKWKDKKVIIGASIGGAVLITVIVICSVLFSDFQAQGYVKAILNQTFTGDVNAAAQMTEGATEKELYAQYEENINSFVEANVLSGIEVDEELKQKYVDVCKKIFKDMKYEVGEEKQADGGAYVVPVTYRPSDVFSKFHAAIQQERQTLYTKVENGEYQGETQEEINGQMQTEFLNNACALFEQAHETMEFGEEETMDFTVKKGEKGLYQLNAEEIGQFLMKIMRLDENQD